MAEDQRYTPEQVYNRLEAAAGNLAAIGQVEALQTILNLVELSPQAKNELLLQAHENALKRCKVQTEEYNGIAGTWFNDDRRTGETLSRVQETLLRSEMPELETYEFSNGLMRLQALTREQQWDNRQRAEGHEIAIAALKMVLPKQQT